ncbi:GNAT family N-acetyltransferase [Paenibacillus sp. NFR01]|uniref:GNAT family N-acetyltransferase n=1 Tax=Paenibacillus sp. NFR01 TaxID=1566279 RepID=UPI0008B01E4F|nr:GNAT family N-acetyltransferase [Paenibacillus sp. NFR01]SEU10008.1 Acetyltransferase (GNAT) domain-containing protein [Paenibacillus sp. NFR01]
MEIRLFKRSETSELMSALNDLWAKNHILSRDENLLNHMFYDHSVSQTVFGRDHYGFLGAWHEGEIIGIFGLMAFEFNVYGKQKMGFAPTNWIVPPEHRHTGAGIQLMRKMLEFDPAVVLNLGINANVARLYKGMGGYQVIPDVPRWIGIQDKDSTIKLLLEGNEKPVRYYDKIRSVEGNPTYKVFEQFDPEKWDVFYSKWAKANVGFSRNAAFLSWRYLNHPSFNYQVFTCENNDGQYKGLLVVRKETILDGKGSIGRIVEFIAEDQDSAIQLANEIVKFSEQNNLLFNDFYCFSSITSWGLEAVGFKRVMKNEADKLVLPTRFKPLDLEITHMMAAMYVSKELQGKIESINDQTWYITKGDADQDRPN